MSSHVKLIGVCPRCGETVELILSKKQVKTLYKWMKLPPTQAMILSDREKEKELNRPLSP